MKLTSLQKFFSWQNENGSGFIESLISLAIGGICCAALLSLSASLIKEAKRTEMRDAMNQYAIEGMEELRWIRTNNPTAFNINSNMVPGNYYVTSSDTIASAGTDLCSTNANSTHCEKLKLNSSPNNLFYRYFVVEPPYNGNMWKITVKVGMLPPRDEMIEPREVVGYIPK
ncbi:hypothetical protein JW887_05115 [Candidatus Dojkabacteria bacterium]|nr:hypothetical protein [Candidatus Dojkabacteria bacterium]